MPDNTTYDELKSLFQTTLLQGDTFTLYRAPEEGQTAEYPQYIVSDALNRVFDYVVGPENPIILHLQTPQNYLPVVPAGVDYNPISDALNAQSVPSSNPFYDDDDQTIGIIGLGDENSVIFRNMIVVAVFSVAMHGDGTPMVHIFLQATPQGSSQYTLDPSITVASWTPFDSFPELYTAPIVANLLFKWEPPDNIPTLTMATYRISASVPAALYFSGEAMLGSAFKSSAGTTPAGVEFLFSSDLTTLSQKIAGTIEYVAEIPNFRLSPLRAERDVSQGTLSIGYFSGVPPTLVSFQSRTIRGFPPNPIVIAHGSAEIHTALAANIGGKTHFLPISGRVTSAVNATLLEMNLSELFNGTTLSPQDVSGLLANFKQNAIPAGNLAGIDLSKHTIPLSLSLQLQAQATGIDDLISYVTLQLQTTQPWSIIKTDTSQLTLSSADVALTLFNPTSKNVTGWSVSIGATIEIGRHDGTIGAGLSYTGSKRGSGTRILISMTGGLITLRDIIGLFMGGGAVDAPPIALESFRLEIDTRTNRYEGELRLVSAWGIDIGGETLEITRLNAALGYKPPLQNPPPKLSGYLASHPAAKSGASYAYFSLSGILKFKGLFEGVLRVEADYPGKDGGWNFTGLALIETTIGGFVANLSDYYTLDAPSLPSVIADLALTEVRVTFNTRTGNFTFTVQAAWLGDDTDSAKLTLHIRRTKQTTSSARLDIQGTLAFYDENKEAFEFGLLFDQSGRSGDTFAAYYNRPESSTLSVYQVMKQLLGDSSSLESETSDFTFGINEALIAYTLPTGAQQGSYIFGFGVGASLDLSALQGLPVIGDLFADAPTLDLAAQLTYASAPVAQSTVTMLNRLFKGHKRQFPATNTGGLPQGFSFAMQLWSEGSPPQTIDMGAAAPSQFASYPTSAPPTTPTAQTNGGLNNGVIWFQIQKTFGPLHISRIGFTYKRDEGTFYGYIDADITVDIVTLSFIELYLGFAFGGDGFDDIQFGLDGLGLQFRLDELSIAGSFYKNENNGVTEYDGYASLGLGPLQLSAIGSFAQADDSHPSLFIFAALDYPLGGLGFFFVTGLSAGFGFNRDLIMPSVSQVPNYWLVEAASKPQPNQPPSQTGSIPPTTTNILNSAIRYAPVSVGEYWLALGLRFTTYEIVQTLAVAALSFGNRFEVDVIGLSTIYVPPTPGGNFSPLAEAQFALIGSFVLETDPFFMDIVIQGQLTPNSYLFSRSCQLTGGFGFGVWIGGENGGDFVATFGGYHPSYSPPSYYPQVPRVGFNWNISNLLHAKGQMYFALTPNAIMTGGSLSILFQLSLPSPLPSLRASFDVGVDFLINWKPYHYEVSTEAEVDIDVIYHLFGTHEISASAGADLSLWGPNWGGHAALHMSVWFIKINFSVNFGAKDGGATPLTWSEFQSSLLPPPQDVPDSINVPSGSTNWNYVTADVTGGLVRQTQVSQDGETRNYSVVDPKSFVISTSSAIPITDLDGAWEPVDYGTLKRSGLGITPMNTSYNSAVHSLKVEYRDAAAQGSFVDATRYIATPQPVARNVPYAMWGTQLLDPKNPASINQNALITNTIGGFTLTAATPVSVGESQGVPRKDFAYDTTPQSGAFGWQTSGIFSESGSIPSDPIANRQTLESIQADMLASGTQTTREGVLNALGFITTQFDLNQDMTQFTAYAPRVGTFSAAQES